ncbi:hypothetical protein F4825DRAFT_272718 [Nemania diffusa]|nr:hypothetical protein F4825DRAFT_272718 [Nemania diffusa]
MKLAPQLKLPSWPPRVLFPHRGPQGDSKDDGNSTSSSSNSITKEIDPQAIKSSDMFGTEPSYQRLESSEAAPPAPVSRFRRRPVRWLLAGVVVLGTVAIILLSTLLTRHAAGGLDTLFKVRLNL